MNTFDLSSYAVDRTIAAMERRRLIAPDEQDERRRSLGEYPADVQRAVIAAYIKRFPCQAGSMFETLGESTALIGLMTGGDTAAIGAYVESYSRAHMVRVIEKDWDFDWRRVAASI